MLKLSELGVAPEIYDREILDRIPWEILKYSRMARGEKQFVNGLVRMFKPKKILELGVRFGGGTAILLNAIKDMPESSVISVDVAEKIGEDKEVGFAVQMLYPDGNAQWDVYRGKDFSEICEGLNEKHDFCVIDTAHLHPVESLNFLTALPYLEDGSIVVFHDISSFKEFPLVNFPKMLMANILCFGTIVGEKIAPVDKHYLFQKDPDNAFGNQYGFSNIGAVQITESTRKYIKNVFDMLLFPWAGYGGLVSSYIKPIAKIIKKSYSSDLFKIFCDAAAINACMVHNDYQYEDFPQTQSIFDTLSSAQKIIFYGAGAYGKNMLKIFKHSNLPKPMEIWDIRADTIGCLDDISVIEPQFHVPRSVYADAIFVITLADKIHTADVAIKIATNNFPKNIFTYCETERSAYCAQAAELRRV